MTTGILVHGCNLGAFQWEHIVWGHPPDRLGRLTRALLIFLQEEYEARREVGALVLGTGVVWTGGGKRNGLMEAHETKKILFARLPELAEFSVFQEQFPAVGKKKFIKQIEARLRKTVVLATECENTAQEMRDAARVFLERGVEKVVLVSSPVHLPRCIKEACVALAEEEIRYNLFAAASDTCYQGTTAADVAIFEPPHRGDRPTYPIHQFVRRISDVPEESMSEFLKRLDDLLEDYGA